MPLRISANGEQTYSNLRFEYGVILKGSQTYDRNLVVVEMFEYGVILKGSQTMKQQAKLNVAFEYGVILKGSQTSKKCTS